MSCMTILAAAITVWNKQKIALVVKKRNCFQPKICLIYWLICKDYSMSVTEKYFLINNLKLYFSSLQAMKTILKRWKRVFLTAGVQALIQRPPSPFPRPPWRRGPSSSTHGRPGRPPRWSPKTTASPLHPPRSHTPLDVPLYSVR